MELTTERNWVGRQTFSGKGQRHLSNSSHRYEGISGNVTYCGRLFRKYGIMWQNWNCNLNNLFPIDLKKGPKMSQLRIPPSLLKRTKVTWRFSMVFSVFSPGTEDLRGRHVPATPEPSPTLYSCPQQQGIFQNPGSRNFIQHLRNLNILETWNHKCLNLPIWES